jgi:hypothetical protein
MLSRAFTTAQTRTYGAIGFQLSGSMFASRKSNRRAGEAPAVPVILAGKRGIVGEPGSGLLCAALVKADHNGAWGKEMRV